jgi:hypothetical protein
MNSKLAFPQPHKEYDRNDNLIPNDEPGMTLREYYAGLAMQRLMDAAIPMSEIAKEAYRMADLMLKAREAE